MESIVSERGTLAWETSQNTPYFAGAMAAVCEAAVRDICAYLHLTVHEVIVDPDRLRVNFTMKRFESDGYLAKEIKRRVWDYLRVEYPWADKLRSLWKRGHYWQPGDEMDWSMLELYETIRREEERVARGDPESIARLSRLDQYR